MKCVTMPQRNVCVIANKWEDVADGSMILGPRLRNSIESVGKLDELISRYVRRRDPGEVQCGLYSNELNGISNSVH